MPPCLRSCAHGVRFLGGGCTNAPSSAIAAPTHERWTSSRLRNTEYALLRSLADVSGACFMPQELGQLVAMESCSSPASSFTSPAFPCTQCRRASECVQARLGDGLAQSRRRRRCPFGANRRFLDACRIFASVCFASECGLRCCHSPDPPCPWRVLFSIEAWSGLMPPVPRISLRFLRRASL